MSSIDEGVIVPCHQCQTPLDLEDALAKLIPDVPSPLDLNLFHQLKGPLAQSESDSIQSSLISLSDATTHLKKLESILEKALRQCQGSLSGHSDQVEEHRRVLSCRRLPEELWCEIFKWCALAESNALEASRDAKASGDSFAFRSASRERAPLLLTAVSREWRDLAIRTHSIWANIDIDFGNTDATVPSSKLSLLNIWLCRSEPSSRLFISVDASGIMQESDDEPPCQSDLEKTVMGMLADHQSRWEVAYFHLPRSWFSFSPFPLSSSGNLKRLTISMGGMDPNQPKEIDSILCQESATPKLKDLVLRNFRPRICLATDLRTPLLPWGAIPSISFTSSSEGLCDDEDLIELNMVASPVRIEASMRPSTPDRATIPVYSTTARNAKLEILKVVRPSPTIFQRLDLPSLDHLRIAVLREGSEISMIEFFKKASRLSRLEIFNVDVALLPSLMPPIASFDFLSNLRKFEITTCSQSQLKNGVVMIQSLADNPTFLNGLEIVRFTIKFLGRFKDEDPLAIKRAQDAILSLIRKRVDNCESPLKRVMFQIVNVKSDFTKNVVLFLRDMALKGLDVQC